MASFEDLGLRDSLLRALEDGDVDHPTALQEAAVPVLRREGNLVARAGSGSGKTLAYALGILDRLEGREEGEGDDEDAPSGTRLLVMVPTPEAAERTALALVPFVHAAGLTLTIPGGGWGTAPGEADVLVATPGDVMAGVRGSTVKLEAVEALVLDGASDVEALGGWEAVEQVFDQLPRDAQRVVFTAQLTEGVEDLAGRRVKRALRWPPQSKVAAAPGEGPAAQGPLGYVPVGEREKVDVLARLLGARGDGDGAPLVFCRSDERAATLAEALALRGFLVGDAGDADADVAIAESGATTAEARGDGAEPSVVISFDVPADAPTLLARHGDGAGGFVLLEPRELPHLRDLAERTGFTAQPAGVSGENAGPSADLRAFRGELRRAIREEDLGAQMLVLEPLFEEFTPAEVAAACAALLRRRPRVAEAAPAAQASASPAAAPAQPAHASRPTAAETGPPPSAIVRLFVSVGERDGVRPGDLMGVIAGEAEIPGSSIGRIDVRDTFSIVEVPADVAERVIRAVNGTTIKGRAARVDYDRGGERGGRPPMRRMDRPGGPPRGGGGDRPFRGGGDRPDRGGPRGGPPRGGAGPRGGGGGGFKKAPPRRPRDDR